MVRTRNRFKTVANRCRVCVIGRARRAELAVTRLWNVVTLQTDFPKSALSRTQKITRIESKQVRYNMQRGSHHRNKNSIVRKRSKFVVGMGDRVLDYHSCPTAPQS
jgi:hypothetical protein